ncbi:MAG: glucose-1-phosphate thymidylyltransferase [Anaerolineae bacterium]|nr:glucose-1-phosphate thymidylyltransferase [Anaerolineae bacterium]
MLTAKDFFDLSEALHAAAFNDTEFVWDALKTLSDYIQYCFAHDFPPGIHPDAQVHPTAVVNEKQVYVGPGAKIAPHAYVEGPAIISAGASVVQGAYVRQDVVLSPGAVLGHTSEAKNSLFLEDAHAPHFAYVGDSILGIGVNIGAGTKLSNLAVSSAKDPVTGKRPTIKIRIGEEEFDTGLAKMGAILGDEAQTGCNTVTNPGVLIAPRTLVYAMASVRKGYYPPDSILKIVQTQEIIERR